jgi:hypothetical protein
MVITGLGSGRKDRLEGILVAVGSAAPRLEVAQLKTAAMEKWGNLVGLCYLERITTNPVYQIMPA